jgi:carbohydrate-selective porin OprB
VQLVATYTGDLLRNTTGGVAVGNAYLDNLDLVASVDAERVFGWRGWSFAAHALYNNRGRFSEPLVGDAQSVSNIDAPRAIRLYEFWGEWRSNARSATSVRVILMNSSFGIGYDIGQCGANGPSIFPVTALGVWVATEFAQRWTLRGVILDAVPGDVDDPSATNVKLSDGEGALLWPSSKDAASEYANSHSALGLTHDRPRTCKTAALQCSKRRRAVTTAVTPLPSFNCGTMPTWQIAGSMHSFAMGSRAMPLMSTADPRSRVSSSCSPSRASVRNR